MAFLCLVMGIRLSKLYLKKKKNEGLYLCLSVFSYLFTIISASIVYLCAGINLGLAELAQKGIYAGVFLSMIFTFLFASKIFFTAKRVFLYLYVMAGIASILAVVLSESSYQSEFPDGSNYPLFLLKLGYGVLLVIYMMPTSFGIFLAGLRVSKKADNPIFRRSFQYISYGILMVLVAFIFDTISSSFMDNLFIYSLFLYLTWVPPVFGVFLYDRGYTLPDRKKKESGAEKGDVI